MIGIISGRPVGAAGRVNGFEQGWEFYPDNSPNDTWSPFLNEKHALAPSPMPARYEKVSGHGVRLRLAGQGSRGTPSRYNRWGDEFLEHGPDGPNIDRMLRWCADNGFVEVNVLGITGAHVASSNDWERFIAVPVFSQLPQRDYRRIVVMAGRLAERIRELGMIATLYHGTVVTPPTGSPLDPKFRYLTEDNIGELLGGIVRFAGETLGFDGVWMDWGNAAFFLLSDPPSSWGTLFGRGKKLPRLYPEDKYEPVVKKQPNRGWWMHEWLVENFPRMRFVTEGHPPDPRLGCVMPSAGIVGTVGSSYPNRLPIDVIPDRMVCGDEHFIPGREAWWFLTGNSPSHDLVWTPDQTRLAMVLSRERGFAGCMIDSTILQLVIDEDNAAPRVGVREEVSSVGVDSDGSA